MEEVYTVAEAAKYLMVSRGTAYNYVKTGKLRTFKVNTTIYVPQNALDEFIEQSNQRGI